MVRAILAGLFVLVIAACSPSRSPACADVCDTEAGCAQALDDPDYTIDEAECMAACASLERDQAGRELIERHIACVQRVEGKGTDPRFCERVAACSE
jgi:hypothetical protein